MEYPVLVSPGRLSVAPAKADTLPEKSVTGPLAVSEVLVPVTVSAPPSNDKAPLIVDVRGVLDDTVSKPPLKSSAFASVRLSIWVAPAAVEY